MAMHYLYAFHIRQQANYHNSLAEIKGAFTSDVFSKEPRNEQQLANAKNIALKFFKNLAAEHITRGVKHFQQSSDNDVVATKVFANYQDSFAKEVKVLKNDFQAILNDILDAYLLTLQLVVEWFMIAQKQVQESEQLDITIDIPKALAHNPIVEALRNNPTFQNLLAERKLSWNADIHIVVRWYNQFIKNAEKLQYVPTSKESNRDYEIVNGILLKIIWEQPVIQQHFDNLYLGWEEIKIIVKNLWHNVDTASILGIFQQQAVFIAPAIAFYTQLIENLLTQDEALEAIIQQYSKAWPLERLVLIDRIILKLGLCEMHYLSDTPGKVVISEYVYLAKKYSTSKSLAFVNGILDAVAKEYNFVT